MHLLRDQYGTTHELWRALAVAGSAAAFEALGKCDIYVVWSQHVGFGKADA
jgi:hypothetical protein